MARLDIELCSPLRHSHLDCHDLGCGLTLVSFGRLWFSRHPDLVDQFNLNRGDRLPCLLVLVFSGPVHETLIRLQQFRHGFLANCCVALHCLSEVIPQWTPQTDCPRGRTLHSPRMPVGVMKTMLAEE